MTEEQRQQINNLVRLKHNIKERGLTLIELSVFNMYVSDEAKRRLRTEALNAINADLCLIFEEACQ